MRSILIARPKCSNLGSGLIDPGGVCAVCIMSESNNIQTKINQT